MVPGMVTVAVEILSLNDAVERGLQVVNILWNICQKKVQMMFRFCCGDDDTKRVVMMMRMKMIQFQFSIFY